MIPEVKATNLTTQNLEQVAAFYSQLFPDATVSEGVFAGVGYKALVAPDGEVEVCIFQAGAGNPLGASFPTIMVPSVSAYLSKVSAMDGRVLISENPCPCTGAPFAICEDGYGNQFMVKEPRA